MTPESIAARLQPYIADAGGRDWAPIYGQLGVYLDLILKWNARTNLTAIRTPEEIVCRHFGESLFAAAHIGPCSTLLDFGSGAGFPGIPIQMVRPELAVTLAESQGKKAAFLREAIRTLALPTQVWADRVESLPSAQRFDTVTLRAVDNMPSALQEAARRASVRIVLLASGRVAYPELEEFTRSRSLPIPNADRAELVILERR